MKAAASGLLLLLACSSQPKARASAPHALTPSALQVELSGSVARDWQRARLAAAGEAAVVYAVHPEAIRATPLGQLLDLVFGMTSEATTLQRRVKVPEELPAYDQKRPLFVGLFDPDEADFGSLALELLEQRARGVRHRVLIPSVEPETTARALAALLELYLEKGADGVFTVPESHGGVSTLLSGKRAALFVERDWVRLEFGDTAERVAAPVRAAPALETPAQRALIEAASDALLAYVRFYRLRDAQSAAELRAIASALSDSRSEQWWRMASLGIAEVIATNQVLDPEQAELDDLALRVTSSGRVVAVASLTPRGKNAWLAGLGAARSAAPQQVNSDALKLEAALATLPSNSSTPAEIADLFNHATPTTQLAALLQAPFGSFKRLRACGDALHFRRWQGLVVSHRVGQSRSAANASPTADLQVAFESLNPPRSSLAPQPYSPELARLLDLLGSRKIRLRLDGPALVAGWSLSKADDAFALGASPHFGDVAWARPNAQASAVAAGCLERTLPLYRAALTELAAERAPRREIAERLRQQAQPLLECALREPALARDARNRWFLADRILAHSALFDGDFERARQVRQEACELGDALACQRLADPSLPEAFALPQLDATCSAPFGRTERALLVPAQGSFSDVPGEGRTLAVLAAPSATFGQVVDALRVADPNGTVVSAVFESSARRYMLDVGSPVHDPPVVLAVQLSHGWEPDYRRWEVTLLPPGNRVTIAGAGAPRQPLSPTELRTLALRNRFADYVIRADRCTRWSRLLDTIAALKSCGGDGPHFWSISLSERPGACGAH